MKILKKVSQRISTRRKAKKGGESGSSSDSSLGSSSPSSAAWSSEHEESAAHTDLFKELQDTARIVEKDEPLIAPLLHTTVLHPSCTSLASLVARTISFRLLQSCSSSSNDGTSGTSLATTTKNAMPTLCDNHVFLMFLQTMQSDELEHGHTMLESIRLDLLACVRRDPACDSPLEALLYYKGFASLVCHRSARRMWKKDVQDALNGSNTATATSTAATAAATAAGGGGDTHHQHRPPQRQSKYVSLWLQSQASAAFGLDIHPAAEIGAGIMFDHGTGIVIGETAKIGDNCTFLHGVTLGGTGKHHGDRHPKVGRDVLIGAGANILGNIRIGDGAKIGAGSVVLKSIPHGCTAVGSPAKIVGFAGERRPGSSMDSTLAKNVPIGGLDDSTRDSVGSSDSSVSVSVTGTKSTADMSDDLDTDESSSSSPQTKVSADKEKQITVEEESSLVGRGLPEKKKKKTKTRSGLDKSFCAFRNFQCKNLPCGAVSFQCLSKMLSNYCTEEEIGEVYVTLLKLNPKYGYIPVDVFLKKFPEVAQKYTSLDNHQCQTVLMANMSSGTK